MKEICCPAMKQAIEEYYVHWPMTYNKKKEMQRLAPTIGSREEGLPVFVLNFCPWCKTQVNQDFGKEEQAMNHRFYFERSAYVWELRVEPPLTGAEPNKQELVEEKWDTVVRFCTEHPEVVFEDIVLGGTTTCAFCVSFHIAGCQGCPIYEKKDKAYCQGTPYSIFEHSFGWLSDYITPLRAAQKEREFIRSLREEG